MFPVKEAVANAIAFASAALGESRVRDARLEEVDSIDIGGDDAWVITLSMAGDHPMLGPLAKREYKTFTVLKRNGEVKSMKIREIAA
jgi:hypothetical protein